MPKPWDWYLVVPILTIAHNADRGQFFFYVHTRFINFEKFFPPTCLFHPTSLLILKIFTNIHFYSILHIHWFLIKYLTLQYTGTLDWGKQHSTGQRYICKEVTSFKIHTLHVYYTLQIYQFSMKNPTYRVISPYTIINFPWKI